MNLQLTVIALVPLCVFLVAVCVHADEVTLKCTADNSICCHYQEVSDSTGDSERLKVKGVENFLLLNFDTTSIRGRTVECATLLLKSAIPNPMLRKVGISTVSTPWVEGRGDPRRPAQAGESNCLSPETGKRTWAGSGSNFAYASFGYGGTFWQRAYLEPLEDGWFKMPVDPRIVESMAQGLSFGISVSDDNGEVRHIHPDVYPDTCHDNNYVYSRESGDDGPRLVVKLRDDTDRTAPGVVKDLKVNTWSAAATFEKGAVHISWVASGNDRAKGRALGYFVRQASGGGAVRDLPRWKIPVPPKPGNPVALVLDDLTPGERVAVEVVAVDEGGNRSPVARAVGKASPARPRPAPPKAVPVALSRGAAPPLRDGKLRVWAFGDGLKVNPVNGNPLEESGVSYAGRSAGRYRLANGVWDGATGTISLRGARGEWVAFQLAIEATDDKQPGLSGIEVMFDQFAGPGKGKRLGVQHPLVSRAWYIKSGDVWYADPLVPVTGKFQIPWAENGVPKQRNQTLYLEFFIPNNALPDTYRGTVRISADGVRQFCLPVVLEVLPFTIPEEVHFVWSMNAYASPGRGWGKPRDPKFLAAERDFYVKSHVHRTCLAIVSYTHGGVIKDDAAPPIEGRGENARVADWSDFDRRFGPLFDGSAFAGTPRAGVPLDHFYLTFHENWPVPIADGYKWNVDKFEDHWKVCGPIEEGFSREYQETWKAVLADFAKHFREKGWTHTRFQIYLNNKFYYKMYKADKKSHGYGVSFWLLDEPHFADDFLAVGFFARMTRQALGGRSDNIVFRIDISRPIWQRDILDGLLDLNVASGHAYSTHRRMVEERRHKFSEMLWTYGGLCKVEESALKLEARALSLYVSTVDGFVPWSTLAGESAWTEPTDTIAFYPGGTVGIDGCVPSLKLKACRRGQQDVEYLWLLGRKRGLDRRGMADLGAATLEQTGCFEQLNGQGFRFKELSCEILENFRRTIARELSQGK